MAVRSPSTLVYREGAAQLTLEALRQQNEIFRDSGGVSEGNRALGFRPAFYDMDTGYVHPSRFANGLEAPMHVLDGLPDDLVVARRENGRVTAVKPGVVAGFVCQGHFYTRQQAALATAQMQDSRSRFSNPDDHDRLLAAWEHLVQDQDYATGVIRPVVEASWRRCNHLVDPELRQAPMVANSEQLEYRRFCQADLREAARPVLQRLGELLHQADSLALLADSDGLILDAAGDKRSQGALSKANLVEGGLWGEQVAGTNAIGTALACAEPVQLYGAEHFCAGIKRYTCSADVIRDPHDGRVLGVFDLSGRTHSYQRHSLDFAMTAARLIEANLVAGYFRCREQVINGSRDAFRRWQSEGLLAFDRRGRLVKANSLAHAALQALGADLTLTPQTRIEALDLERPASSPEAPSWLTSQRRQAIRLNGEVVGTLVILPCCH